MTLNGSLSLLNTASQPVDITIGFNINGSSALLGGRYIGLSLPPNSFIQLPVSMYDRAINLNTSTIYTVDFFVQKLQSVGPVLVKDAFMSLEYSL